MVKNSMNQAILLIKVGKRQQGRFYSNQAKSRQKKTFIFRWVKFEEDVESGGRWSKPHVATLSLHSLLELRNCIFNGSILLDMQADQLPIIIGLFDFRLFLNVMFFF